MNGLEAYAIAYVVHLFTASWKQRLTVRSVVTMCLSMYLLLSPALTTPTTPHVKNMKALADAVLTWMIAYLLWFHCLTVMPTDMLYWVKNPLWCFFPDQKSAHRPAFLYQAYVLVAAVVKMLTGLMLRGWLVHVFSYTPYAKMDVGMVVLNLIAFNLFIVTCTWALDF